MEKKHRLEEDELYEEMVEERRRQVEHLEQSLVAEREHTVRELIAWFENQDVTQQERDAGLKKVCFRSLVTNRLTSFYFYTVMLREYLSIFVN